MLNGDGWVKGDVYHSPQVNDGLKNGFRWLRQEPHLGHPLFGRADDDVRKMVFIQTEVTPAQRQHLVKVPEGVPQGVDQRVLRPVREVVQQAGDFGCQQIAGQPDRPFNGR